MPEKIGITQYLRTNGYPDKLYTEIKSYLKEKYDLSSTTKVDKAYLDQWAIDTGRVENESEKDIVEEQNNELETSSNDKEGIPEQNDIDQVKKEDSQETNVEVFPDLSENFLEDDSTGIDSIDSIIQQSKEERKADKVEQQDDVNEQDLNSSSEVKDYKDSNADEDRHENVNEHSDIHEETKSKTKDSGKSKKVQFNLSKRDLTQSPLKWDGVIEATKQKNLSVLIDDVLSVLTLPEMVQLKYSSYFKRYLQNNKAKGFKDLDILWCIFLQEDKHDKRKLALAGINQALNSLKHTNISGGEPKSTLDIQEYKKSVIKELSEKPLIDILKDPFNRVEVGNEKYSVELDLWCFLTIYYWALQSKNKVGFDIQKEILTIKYAVLAFLGLDERGKDDFRNSPLEDQTIFDGIPEEESSENVGKMLATNFASDAMKSLVYNFDKNSYQFLKGESTKR